MNLYILVILGTGLITAILLFRRATRRAFDRQAFGGEQEAGVPAQWDSLASELGAKIFDSQDEEYVRLACSPQLGRRFRAERTALALDWLREVRRQVNLLFREHLRSARSNSSLQPTDELKLGWEFLLFQVTSGFLYLVTWLFGPSYTAKLASYPQNVAEELRKMTSEAMPGGARVVVELLDTEPKPGNRAAS